MPAFDWTIIMIGSGGDIQIVFHFTLFTFSCFMPDEDGKIPYICEAFVGTFQCIIFPFYFEADYKSTRCLQG
jgi:hypothetical protein